MTQTLFVAAVDAIGRINFRIGKSKASMHDLVFKSADGISLKGDLYLPKKSTVPAPVVLLVPGGGWRNAGDMDRICVQLKEAGFAAFSVNYRMAPQHIYPKAIEDIRDAVGWIKKNAAKYNLDETNIMGWGYSAGAHLILMVGLDSSVGISAIVAGGTPADFMPWSESPLVTDFLGHTQEENPNLWREASPVNRVTTSSPPVFLYHGEKDRVVGIDQMKRMETALKAKGRPVETHVVKNRGHMSVQVFDRESIFFGIAFLRRHLR